MPDGLVRLHHSGQGFLAQAAPPKPNPAVKPAVNPVPNH